MEDTQQSDSAIMAANGLLYKMPQPLSTCVNKTYRKEYAQRSYYSEGDTIVFDVNSGSAYIDPSSCMISFDVVVTFTGTPGDAATRVTFGSGMATNLFEEIRILSKNGTEIDRTQNAHILAKIRKDYAYSGDALIMLENAGLNAEMMHNTSQEYVVPLGVMSGFFRPTVKGMKIPAGLASGLRIELITSNAARALTKTAGAGVGISYVISKPELLFCSMDLNDPTQSALMKNSAETGLEYTFPSTFSVPFVTTQEQVNEQIKKAVSQATKIFTTVYDVSGADSVLLETRDGFKSIASEELVNFQYRVGANYYPQKHVSKKSEALYLMNEVFDKQRDLMHNANSVSLSEYDTEGVFAVGIPLETDSRLNLSGLPLNNSNVAELRMQVSNSLGLSRQFNMFVEYISVSRSFVNKSSVKI